MAATRSSTIGAIISRSCSGNREPSPLPRPMIGPVTKGPTIPFRHAPLPPNWEAFRRELVARRADGNREFVRILQLCLTHPEAEVGAAMELAAAAGTYS